ncbi:betaine-homocysteine S-methyltransferase-like isoform X3 [Lissotriton helveticus]
MADVKILDGGLSSELDAGGFLIKEDPLWSARVLQTNPLAIKDVHLRFLRSGADVITTATYQASVVGFQKYLGMCVEDATELMCSGVKIAKEAADKFSSETSDKKRPLIAGSVGPYGAFLHDCSEYSGSYVDTMSVEELMAWHRPQLQCLESAGVDLFALETIPSQKEAEAFVALLREFPNTKAWLSFSCKDDLHIYHGEKFKDAINVATRTNQLVAVGVNCSPPTIISSLLTSANKNNLDIQMIVYPNGGGTWDLNVGWSASILENTLASYAVEWADLGAKWIEEEPLPSGQRHVPDITDDGDDDSLPTIDHDTHQEVLEYIEIPYLDTRRISRVLVFPHTPPNNQQEPPTNTPMLLDSEDPTITFQQTAVGVQLELADQVRT